MVLAAAHPRTIVRVVSGLPWPERGLPRDLRNTARETRARFEYQDACVVLRCIPNLLPNGQVAAVAIEWTSDYVVLARNGRVELVSVKHREEDQPPWTFGDLVKEHVFRDLHGIWKQMGEDGDYVFESNRGFSRPLRSAVAKAADPGTSEAAKLADAIGVSAEDAVRFASRLVLPSEPVPDRRHIRDVATTRLAAVMQQLGLDPRLAGAGVKALEEHVAAVAVDRPLEPERRVKALAGLMREVRDQGTPSAGDFMLTMDELREVVAAAATAAGRCAEARVRPSASDPLFSGREAELASLGQLIAPGPDGLVTPVVLTGMPQPTALPVYLEQVRRIAPPHLIDRDAEIAELARFCLALDGTPYAWWQADPWAGKSALLSTFVLRPPPELARRVQIVSFFITDRLAAQDTREAFIQVLIEQLAALLGQSLPAGLTEVTREAYLLGLLAQAAAACKDAGGRMVLVVDGLDEDRGVTTGPDAHSIAGLLPADPPAGMRVIVAGRPNPRVPDDVPDWHPLRDPAIIRPLPASAHARDVQRLARQELQRLLRGSPVEQEVLGFLASARGGLSARDLSDLADAPLWEVEEILHTVAGRTFQGRPSLLRPVGPEVYLLGHEELQAAATDYLSGRLAGYRERLHSWAAGWRARRWPAETPEYLLAGYFRLLDDLGDLPRMTGLAGDMARHDLMLRLTGGDAAALTEISAAQAKLLAQDQPDLASLTMLAFLEDRLINRNSYISPLLPGVLARLGSTRRAEQAARSLRYPGPQARALAEIAAAIAETEPEHARRLIDDAENLSHADWSQDEALPLLAAAAGRIGDYDRAERLCRMIKSPGSMAAALGEVAGTLAAADPDRARRLAGEAEQIAGSATEPREQATALQGAAVAMARIGETDRARRLAYDITPEWSRGIALRALVGALAGSGRHAEAKQLADSITDIRSQVGALADLARALAGADLAWCDRIVDEAWQLASQLRPRPRADAVGELAAALAVADQGRSHSLADEAEEYARSAQDPGPEVTLAELAARLVAAEPEHARHLADEAERLARGDTRTRSVAIPVELAEAMADAGHHDCARELISMLSDPETQARATGRLAAALARAGEYERAEQLIGTITGSRGWPAVKLAAALAHAGEYDRAERLISTITGYRTLSVAKRELSTALSEAGQPDRAECVARTIAKPWHRNVALGEVAVAGPIRSARPGRGNHPQRRQRVGTTGGFRSTGQIGRTPVPSPRRRGRGARRHRHRNADYCTRAPERGPCRSGPRPRPAPSRPGRADSRRNHGPGIASIRATPAC